MHAASVLLRISQSTVVLMAAGWIAVVFTSVFLPGGHPPLSAYVGMAVIVASWVLGAIGLLASLASLAGKSPRRNVTLLFACLNAGLLAFSVLVIFQ